MEIPDYIIQSILTAIISGVVAFLFSHFSVSRKIDKTKVSLSGDIKKLSDKIDALNPSILKLFTQTVLEKMGETFLSFFEKKNPQLSAGRARAKELMDKYNSRTLTYDEATELKSVAEKCFAKANKRNDHSKMTYLTMLIGTLEVMMENLKKKSGQP